MNKLISFKIFLLLFTFFSISFFLSGQDKIEFERSIKKEEVPDEAVAWIESTYNNSKKVKWIYEFSSGKTSFEAKFKWKKQWHSVEFDDAGVIEDIEISIKKSELSEKLLASLNEYFRKEYKKSKIVKIQKQYTGQSRQLQNFIKSSSGKGLTLRYEIEFYGKIPEADDFYEGLFDADGEIINLRKIAPVPSGNFDY